MGDIMCQGCKELWVFCKCKKASGAQPGNKNASKADAKTAVITIRVTEEQKERLKRHADGRPLSEWVMEAVEFCINMMP